jgi:hypothetical protein
VHVLVVRLQDSSADLAHSSLSGLSGLHAAPDCSGTWHVPIGEDAVAPAQTNGLAHRWLTSQTPPCETERSHLPPWPRLTHKRSSAHWLDETHAAPSTSGGGRVAHTPQPVPFIVQ